METLRKFVFDETANDAAEYALILTFVALAIITAVTGLGTQLAKVFTDATGKITG